MEWGFARPDGNGGYEPGPRILTLAGRVMTSLDPARRADAALTSLHERTGAPPISPCAAETRRSTSTNGRGAGPTRWHRGWATLRLHSTAIGKVVLAWLGHDEVGRIVARTGLAPMTPRTITGLPELLAHLDRVRALGHALDDEENEHGVRCVGAPVFDHTGQILGGISISTLALDTSIDDLVSLAPEVVSAAREVSVALGTPDR